MRFSRGGTKAATAWMLGILLLLCCPAPPAVAVSELDYGTSEHHIYKIRFRGNAAFDDDRLRAQMRISEPNPYSFLSILGFVDRSSLYQPHLVQTDLALVKRFYQRNGFHEVEVELRETAVDPEGRGDILTIHVDEGPRTILEDVIFAGAGDVLPDDFAERLEFRGGSPSPVGVNSLGADLYAIRNYFWARGFLQATISPAFEERPALPDGSPARRIVYTIRTGPRFVVGDIEVRGLEITKPEIVEESLRIREGDPCRWTKVEESQRVLLETALFRDVSFEPVLVDTLTGRADLLLQVVERKPAYLEFGFGVGSRERIRALVAWGHNNLFGTGRQLRVRARNSLNYEDVQRLSDGEGDPELNYRYDVIHTFPKLFNHFRFDTSVFLGRETRGESGLNLDRRGVAAGTRWGLGNETVNTLELAVERVKPTVHPDAVASLQEAYEASGIGTSSTHSLSWRLVDEERDNPVRPTTGSLKATEVKVGGGLFGGDNSFWKLEGSWHKVLTTPLGGVLAFRVNAGVVQPYAGSADRGADGVPYQERFFAGGVSTVRGYQERSLGPQLASAAVRDSLQLGVDVPLSDQPARGGNYRLLTNAEWRFPMPLLRRWKMSGAVFVDGGNVWESLSDIRLKGFRWRSYPGDPDESDATKLWDYRWSTGFGVRLDTIVGPVRMDVGFPLKRAQFTNLDDVTETDDSVLYHFSLGYPF